MALKRVSVLHAWGAGSGPDRLHVELRDEALIAQIGVVEDDVEFSDVTTLAELTARAQAEFDRRKNVFTSAVVRSPLSVLPDDLTVGDKVTLIDSASGTVVAMDVREIAIEEDAGSGEIIRLGLGTEIRDIIDEVLAGRAKPSGVRAITPPTSPVPQSLANVTVTFSPDELYADAQGNWWVRATLNLSGVPRDTRREFIQVRYRRVGDQLYVAGPVIYTKAPTAAAGVAGLVPYVTYEFRIVPVGVGGVEGAGVAVTHTTRKDTQPPSQPTLTLTGIIRGLSANSDSPTEADFDEWELYVSTVSGFNPTGWNGSAWVSAPNAPKDWNGTTNTLAATGKRLPLDWQAGTPGTTYYARLVKRDTSGNRSAPSAEVSAVAAAAGPALNTWHMEFGPDSNAPKRIAWRDVNNVLGIVIGDVRDLQTEMGSTMEFGLALLQGEIRASSSVLQQSLVPSSVTDDHLATGSVVGSAIPDRSIYPAKLSDWICIVEAGSKPVHLVSSSDAVVEQSVYSNSTYTLKTLTIPKRDNTAGRLMEVARIYVETYNDVSNTLTWRLLIDGSAIYTWYQNTGSWQSIEVVVDFRSKSDGNHTFALQVASGSLSQEGLRVYARNFRIYQNNQLPVRFGQPMYTFVTGVSGGCYTACQVTGQTGCGITCEATCQAACQTSCQASCQNTCQTASQGGGGCIREGTPVTVWDPETRTHHEVPVEQLQPGMILPHYEPATDSITYGRLLELRDALYSPRFYRIRTDVGPSIDVTQEQPFDVWWESGPHGPGWYRVQARHLTPGMKMVRPFDVPERRIATITRVETVREKPPGQPGVHFWWPITDNGGFVVAGYHDPIKS